MSISRIPSAPAVRWTLARQLLPRSIRLAACLLVLLVSSAHATHCVDYRAHLPMRSYLGAVTVNAFTFAGEGTRALMAGHDWTYFFDISNLDAPALLFSENSRSDVAIFGDRAWSTFAGINGPIKGYTVPQFAAVGSLPLSGSVTAHGQYAYVFKYEPISIVDASVQVVGTMTLPSGQRAHNVGDQGGFAFVTASDGLHVFDITQVATPVQVGFLPRPNCGSLGLAPDRAYVRAGENLLVCDVSNPASPAILGSVDVSSEYTYGDLTSEIVVSGTRLYLNSGNGFEIVDVSNEAAPHIVGVAAANGGMGLTVVDGYVVVGNWWSEVVVFDATGGTSVEPLGQVAVPGSANHVRAQGTHAYVLGDTGLHVVDLTVPPSPQVVGSISTPGAGLDLDVQGNLACVAAGSAGLRIIDVSNPTNPIELSSIAGDIRHVALGNGFVYASSATLFLVVDLANPEAPVVRSSSGGYWPGHYEQLIVLGSYVYGTAGYLTEVQNVSNPAAPTQSFVTGQLYDAAVSGSLVVGVDGNNEIIVQNVSNPSMPVTVGGGDKLPFMPRYADPPSVGLSDGVAYVPFNRGVAAIDVSNPAVLRSLGNALGPEYPQDIVVSEGYVLVAGGDEGLWVLPTHCTATDTPEFTRGRDALTFLAPHPNPAPGHTSFRIVTPGSTRVDLQIYDIAGRRVRQMFASAAQASPQAIYWDGSDDRGQAVASGVYIVQARSAGATATQRVTLLR